jgi:CelD/BcsL family acetyltransferase involved in cellulose biosynthesis
MILYEAFTITRRPAGFGGLVPRKLKSLAQEWGETRNPGGSMAHEAGITLDLPNAPPRQAAAADGHGLVPGIVWFRDAAALGPLVAGLEGSPFQSRHWLAAWLDVFGAPAIEPFLLTLADPAGVVLLALPLVRRRERGLAVIEVPDLGVTDYAAPLLRRDRLADLPGPAILWRLLSRALPPADLLRLNRMPPVIAGMANPLHAHPAARRHRISGWRLALPAEYPAYLAALGKSHRENLGKLRRRFERVEGAEIAVIRDIPTACAALAELDRMQAARVREMGRDYHLDQPRIAAFYRRLVETGIETGETLMCRLGIPGETLAVNYAVRAGDQLVYLRLTNAFGEWIRHSLGTIVTDQAIREALAQGVTTFDFAMGDYEYKRRFGAVIAPLHDLVLPLSAKGLPAAAFWHLRDRIAKSGIIRRLTGRSVLPADPA